MSKKPVAKERRHPTAYEESTCLIRITKELKEFIVGQGHWGNSIDYTLRRLLNMKQPVENNDSKKVEA